MTSSPSEKETEYRLGFEQGAKARPVKSSDGREYVALNEKDRLIEVLPNERQLLRIKQAPHFHDAASFSAYVNRFKTDATQIFAVPASLSSMHEPLIHAVLDYHEKPGSPDYCQHHASFKPRFDERWETWRDACGSPIAQREFAEMIEEHRQDVVEPSAAALVDLVRTFKMSRKVDFNSVRVEKDGSTVLGFSDVDAGDGKSTVVPDQMSLGIPVYFRGEAFKVPVWLRYRLQGAAVGFIMKIDRIDHIEQTAFETIVAEVTTATGITPYIGSVGA